MAHLQRELNYYKQLVKEKWNTKFSNLIGKALKLKSNMKKETTAKFKNKVRTIIKISEKLEGPTNLIAFKKRLEKKIDNLRVFLQHYDVPADNNGSERTIRNVKVKQKISGQFKSSKGAYRFVVLHSVIDSAIK